LNGAVAIAAIFPSSNSAMRSYCFGQREDRLGLAHTGRLLEPEKRGRRGLRLT
jgi:hypothetical protein